MSRFPRTQLRHLSETPITNGLGLSGSNDNPDWPRYIRTTDIASPTRLRDDVFASQPPAIASTALLSPGDLLMTAAGASIGKSVLFDEPYPACYAGFLVRLRPRSADEGRYLGYWMQSRDYWDQIAVGAVKSTIENFSASRYRALNVPLPSRGDQRAIVDYLDQETAWIDALVTKQEEFIKLLRERRLSMVESYVWSGLDRTAATSEAGIGLVTNSPSHWRRLRNKNLFREVIVPSKDGREELLTVSHLTGVTPRSMKNVNMFEAVTTEGYKVVEVGDLAINTMWAWMGALGISAYRGIVSPAYGVYRPTSEEVESGYFDHLFRSRRYVVEMTRHSRGVTASRLRLYPESFLRLGVVVPPADEQRAIARRISQEAAKIDLLIAKANEHIALVKERRSALITAAVTGQLDVRTAQRGA